MVGDHMAGQTSVTKGAVLAGFVYIAAFVGHIFAAANGHDVLFRSIAIFLTMMTLCMGPVVAWLAGGNDVELKGLAFNVGFAVSLPLSLGLAYAYADQTFNVVLSGVFLAITFTVHLIVNQWNK